jgi:hypothetical protein
MLLTMGQPQPGAAYCLSWLWREKRIAASVLIIAVGILLTCASGFAASEVAVLSTVQVAHAQDPAVIQLGAGTYDISQDIGDVGFPDDPTGISITGPGSPVPVWSGPQVLTPYDAVAVFLGAWDCYRVMSFTIPRAGSYRISIKDRSGMSAAWISAPYTRVARQLFPWALGFVAALITIAVCLIVAVVHRHPVRRMAQDKATAEFR